MSSTYALGREIRAFVCKETTAGTLVDPVSADEVLVLDGDVNQGPELIDDKQRRNSRSKLAPIIGRTLLGDWKLSTYMKASGALGTAPELDDLLECALGVETINASTSVVYSLASELPSCSIWFKRGHTLHIARGCTVDKANFKVAGAEIGTAGFEGKLMDHAIISEDTLNGAIDNSVTTITVTNGTQFYIPASGIQPYIQIDSEVMKVTARSGNNLTVTRAQKTTSAASHSDGATITPWIPTGTETGAPVHGARGTVTLAGTAYNIIDAEITIENGIVYNEDEKTGNLTVTRYWTPEHRNVMCSINRRIPAAHTKDYTAAMAKTSQALVVTLGNASGYIWTFSAPQVYLEGPQYSNGADVTQALKIRCVASSSLNDELTITQT